MSVGKAMKVLLIYKFASPSHLLKFCIEIYHANFTGPNRAYVLQEKRPYLSLANINNLMQCDFWLPDLPMLIREHCMEQRLYTYQPKMGIFRLSNI